MQERGKETSMNIKNIFTLIELNVLFFDGHVDALPFARIPDQDETKGVYNSIFYRPWEKKIPPGW